MINDDYYKVQKNLPRKIEDLRYFAEKDKVMSEWEYNEQAERNRIRDQIIFICNSILPSKVKSFSINSPFVDTHFRIDGLLYNIEKKQLIIITDKMIIEYRYDNETSKFIEIIKILIVHIDYITLNRDNNLMILHLVSEATIAKNYKIADKNLNRVVGCLSSTFFYDKHNYSYPKDKSVMRKIPVILVNQNITELIRILENTNDFNEYREVYNNFLNRKLSIILKDYKLNLDFYIYTCVSYKDSLLDTNTKFKQGDLVIDLNNLFILDYIDGDFVLKITIALKSISQIKNKENTQCFVVFDNEKYTTGIEIKSDNCLGIRDLLLKTIQVWNSS